MTKIFASCYIPVSVGFDCGFELIGLKLLVYKCDIAVIIWVIDYSPVVLFVLLQMKIVTLISGQKYWSFFLPVVMLIFLTYMRVLSILSGVSACSLCVCVCVCTCMCTASPPIQLVMVPLSFLQCCTDDICQSTNTLSYSNQTDVSTSTGPTQ